MTVWNKASQDQLISIIQKRSCRTLQRNIMPTTGKDTAALGSTVSFYE